MREEELEELLKIESDRRREEEPLRYVLFNEAVKRYAVEWARPGKNIVIFAAPNSIGKTWGTTACLGWTMWPEFAPDWFWKGMFHKVGRIDKSFRICSTREEADSLGTLQRAIRSLWPKKRFDSEKNRKPFDSVFKTDTGWIGDIMTYDQEAKEFEGATRGIIIYNEPPPRAIRQACVSRTRMGGFEVFPGTPLTEAAWLKDELVDRASHDDSVAVVGGDIEEACIEHSVNGHLHHDRIQYLIKQMDPDEVEARARGKFMHLSGLIYKNFSREQFMSKTTLQFNPLGFPFQVIDPGGFNKPFAMIWGQVSTNPLNGIQILREWPDGSRGPEHYFESIRKPELRIEDYCRIFEEVEKSIGFQKDSVHRILDKRFGHVRDNTTGFSMRDHFAEKGYFFNDSYSVPEKQPELQTGIQAVKNYLKVDSLTNLPYLLLDLSCVNMARALERWSLDPKTGKPNDDVWKNMCDVLRYACAANLAVVIREAWDEMKAPSWG